jgi:hypothetical protein
MRSIFWRTRGIGARLGEGLSLETSAGYLYRIAGWVFGIGELQAVYFVDYPKLHPVLFFGDFERLNVSDAKDDLHGGPSFLRHGCLVQCDCASA